MKWAKELKVPCYCFKLSITIWRFDMTLPMEATELVTEWFFAPKVCILLRKSISCKKCSILLMRLMMGKALALMQDWIKIAGIDNFSDRMCWCSVTHSFACMLHLCSISTPRNQEGWNVGRESLRPVIPFAEGKGMENKHCDMSHLQPEILH